jgi:hypothetical protein
VLIGADVQSVFYVSPAGDDSATGTRKNPWKTLARATAALRPGHTLLLLDGEYTKDTTGLLDVDCTLEPRRGRDDAPIVVRAERERGAALRGDGELVPLRVDYCAHWTFEGLLLTNEHNPDVPPGTDVGSGSVIWRSEDITLRRNLWVRSNRERHTHLLRIVESDRVLVEENEGYDFYHNAFEAVRTQGGVFRRNYLHSRFAVGDDRREPINLPNVDPERGDIGIQIEESADNLLENNLVEVVANGFSVVGRHVDSTYTDPMPFANAGTRLYGNIVRDSTHQGFRVESRCDDASPCTYPERVVLSTLISDAVALQGATGFSVDAAPATSIVHSAAVRVKNGFHLLRAAANAGMAYTARVNASLVRNFSGVGFWADGANEWAFSYCAAQDPGQNAVEYSPADERVQAPIWTPIVDACIAQPDAESLLRGAAEGGSNVGPQLLYRYHQGQLTEQPLWDEETAAFPCGAVVPGVNDDPEQSCSGAHLRLGIGSARCPLPYAELREM